jgi:hypothetical protein
MKPLTVKRIHRGEAEECDAMRCQMSKFGPVHDALAKLCEDADSKDMKELAFAYNWSMLRIEHEHILAQLPPDKLTKWMCWIRKRLRPPQAA